MIKAFEIAGYTVEDVKKKFGALFHKSIVPSSDNSYIGKSTIKQKRYTSFSSKSNSSPSFILEEVHIQLAVSDEGALQIT